MRRFSILALFTLISISVPTLAQQRFSIGPRVGANFAKLLGDAAPNSLRPGLAAGAFVMYSSLNHFGMSADILYSQRGGKFTGFTTNGTVTQTYDLNERINYLEIPIALRYFLTTSGDFRPNLFFGPSVGIKLNANADISGLGNIDFGPAVRPVDLGVLAGFQLNFPGLGERQRFLVDARYTYGLTNISTSSSNINNSTVTLTLGYGFGVGPEYRSRYKTIPARRR